jgi:hypothetical protein
MYAAAMEAKNKCMSNVSSANVNKTKGSLFSLPILPEVGSFAGWGFPPMILNSLMKPSIVLFR